MIRVAARHPFVRGDCQAQRKGLSPDMPIKVLGRYVWKRSGKAPIAHHVQRALGQKEILGVGFLFSVYADR